MIASSVAIRAGKGGPPPPGWITRSDPDDDPGASAGRSLRVLIVEDEAITALHVGQAVRALGHTVVQIVASGPAAVAAAGRLAPDLVLMDIRLARGTDGVDAAIEIRRAYDIPSIFMSAHSDPQTSARAEPAQPIGYLTKPFANAEISAIFELALARLS